jgi:hypothetical protein
VRPGTPSIGFGKRMPCQWTVVEVIAHHDSERIALPNSEFRAGHRAIVGPYGSVRMAFAGQVDVASFAAIRYSLIAESAKLRRKGAADPNAAAPAPTMSARLEILIPQILITAARQSSRATGSA